MIYKQIATNNLLDLKSGKPVPSTNPNPDPKLDKDRIFKQNMMYTI